ncbi:YesL family protein [Enterococcus sp. DIV0876]|uniref:YesL family protein n=1 Tax=Enterococcus sp. DIV0876 TaxID=2774633 RepID=UPI003D2FD70C
MKIKPVAYYLDVVMKFAYLNILWLGFTLLGVGIVGFFPATMTVCVLLRGYILDGEMEWTIKGFLACYQRLFIRSNSIGGICLLLVGAMAVNVQLMVTTQEQLLIWLRLPVLLTTLGALQLLLYIFPIAVQSIEPIHKLFFTACCLVLAYPLRTGKLLLSLLLICGVFFLFPVCLVLFSGSASLYLVMNNYLRIHEKANNTRSKKTVYE